MGTRSAGAGEKRQGQRSAGAIRVGIGGWSYEPWRKTFYPAEVAKKGELAYASRQLSAIEINSTFYRLQTPAVFAKWRDDTPEDFMFTIKAPRYLTNRKVLREAEPYLSRFFASGLSELGAKLGPILWQLAPFPPFDPDDLDAFLELLPKSLDGRPLRNALEVRHKSYMSTEYLDLVRKHSVASAFVDTDAFPSFADVTGEFVYARLKRTVSSEPTGYSTQALEAWATRATAWSEGHEPDDLPRVGKAAPTKKSRDVFMFFISGAKERAPAAAMKLISCLK